MRYKITIEYDGTSLLGWQEQLDGPSVQDYLQKALNCFTPVNDTDTCSLNNKEKSEEDFPIQELYEEAGTGRRLQKTNAFFNNDFSEAYAGGSTERRTTAYTDVREDASTGRRLQKTNAFFNNDFSETYAGGSTERRTAAYTDVREDASTGRRLQKTDKIIVSVDGFLFSAMVVRSATLDYLSNQVYK